MQLHDFAWVLPFAAALGSLAGIFKFWKYAGPYIKSGFYMLRSHKRFEEIQGQIANLTGLVEGVAAQLKTNGGTTLKDAIVRLETRSVGMEQLLMTSLANNPDGVLKLNQEGECEWANRKFCRISGRSLDEVQGNGWVNTLHPLERDRILLAWNSALEDQRDYDDIFRMLTPEGVAVTVVFKALVMKGPMGSNLGYMVTVTPKTGEG